MMIPCVNDIGIGLRDVNGGTFFSQSVIGKQMSREMKEGFTTADTADTEKTLRKECRSALFHLFFFFFSVSAVSAVVNHRCRLN
jgi:hypothetical protein